MKYIAGELYKLDVLTYNVLRIPTIRKFKIYKVGATKITDCKSDYYVKNNIILYVKDVTLASPPPPPTTFNITEYFESRLDNILYHVFLCDMKLILVNPSAMNYFAIQKL